MKYHVKLTRKAEKKLAKLDKSVALSITSWLRKNLEGCENPRLYGKPLTGDFSGEWRYRVGDYRIIADIRDDRVLILLLDVDHRSRVYR